MGVLSLRDLIVAQPGTLIGQVMIDEPVAVPVTAQSTNSFNVTGSAQIKSDRREPGDREQHADKVGL